MSIDDLSWAHHFCLACDKQTDGATYCSESCRLLEFEKTCSSSASSGASSPALAGPALQWTFSNPATTSTRFYLSPAYDFSNPQPYRSLPSRAAAPLRQYQRPHASSLAPPARMLSQSSSHSSLCSVQSNASATAEASSQLSDKARMELRAYASSFEHARLQRRRSY